MSDIIHSRRLYFFDKLSDHVVLEEGQHHYIRNVMRMQSGDIIRLFNENDGEWVYSLTDIAKKKSIAQKQEQYRKPVEKGYKRILCAPILPKERMFWMLEKATELGMTDFQPIISERSDLRQFKADKAHLQTIEAAEQCERLTIPQMHSILPLQQVLDGIEVPILAAIERHAETKSPREILENMPAGDMAVLIGPPGGFTENEKNWLLSQKQVKSVDLGERILRSETTACALLTVVDIFS